MSSSEQEQEQQQQQQRRMSEGAAIAAGAAKTAPAGTTTVRSSMEKKRKHHDEGSQNDYNYNGGDEDTRDETLEDEKALRDARRDELRPTVELVPDDGEPEEHDDKPAYEALLGKVQELICSINATGQAGRDAIETLRETPYLAECWKHRLDSAFKYMKSLDNLQETSPTLTQQEIRLLNSMEDGTREEMKQILINSKINSKLKDISLELITELTTDLTPVREALGRVRVQLLMLANLSQAEGTTITQSSRVSKSQRTQDSAPSTPRGDFQKAEPQGVYRHVIAHPQDIKDALPTVFEWPRTEGAKEKIKSAAQTFDKFLGSATILRGGDEDKQKLQDGLNCLRGRLELPTSGSTTNSMYAPGPMVKEEEGTQPFFQLLLEAIGGCFAPSAALSASPLKNHIGKEKTLPQTTSRQKRKIDFLLSKEGKWEAVVFDDTLTVPVELKRGFRTDKSPRALLEQAAQAQVLSHLAKFLHVGFTFCHYGAPCYATGLVGNMAMVRVLRLGYENCFSKDARLVLWQSGLLPLMFRANFQRWTKDLANLKTATLKNKFADLEKELFGRDGLGGMIDGVPAGMVVLGNLMERPSSDLYGLSVETKSEVLGDQLGAGATAVVFRRAQEANTTHPNSVVKVSRYGFGKYMENEIKVLQKLATQVNSVHIPSLVNESDSVIKGGKLRIMLGSVPTELPAIETTPAGKKADLLFLASSEVDSLQTRLRLVLDGIKAALEYMHKRRICHCDVTPKNMIIAGGDDDDRRAVLIDFSISSEMEKNLKGFHGTPNYAHREIFSCHFTSKKWKPRPDHDKAGLGFSLVFFANGCVRPWNVGNYPKVAPKSTDPRASAQCDLENTMNDRFSSALGTLENLEVLDDQLKNDIKELLHCDKLTDAMK